MIEINRDLKADKQINKHLLDEEAEMQPYVFGEWASLAVDAKDEADRAKLTLEKVKSERFMFHKTPDEPGDKPPSDKVAEHMVNADSEVIEAHEAYLAANKVWGFCKVAEESMQQKRSMIKILTELHSTKYFDKEEMGVDIRANKVKTKESSSKAMDEGVSEMNKKRKKKKITAVPVVEEPEEDLYDVVDEEDEETIYQTTHDEEMDLEPDLDLGLDEDTPPVKAKRTVGNKAAESKLKAQKNKKKRTVKEQAEINIAEGKKLQAEIAEKKKENKPKGKCPFGYKFGTDFGLEPECDECEIDTACYKARPKGE